jgi:hypothetical protein
MDDIILLITNWLSTNKDIVNWLSINNYYYSLITKTIFPERVDLFRLNPSYTFEIICKYNIDSLILDDALEKLKILKYYNLSIGFSTIKPFTLQCNPMCEKVDIITLNSNIEFKPHHYALDTNCILDVPNWVTHYTLCGADNNWINNHIMIENLVNMTQLTILWLESIEYNDKVLDLTRLVLLNKLSVIDCHYKKFGDDLTIKISDSISDLLIIDCYIDSPSNNKIKRIECLNTKNVFDQLKFYPLLTHLTLLACECYKVYINLSNQLKEVTIY